MSDLNDALERAVCTRLLEGRDSPGVVTDWVVLGVTQGADVDVTSYHFVVPEGISPHALTGLLVHMTDKIRLNQTRAVGE